MRASQRPGASSSGGVGTIWTPDQSRFEALVAGPFDHAATERRAALVVVAVELQPDEPLDEALGLAALDAVALDRLVDLVVGRDEPAPDPPEHVVGVALEHRREHPEAAEHLALAVGLHRAEELVGPLRERLQRLGVHRVEVAEAGLEDVGVELVRRHVLGRRARRGARGPTGPSAAPRARPRGARRRSGGRRGAATTRPRRCRGSRPRSRASARPTSAAAGRSARARAGRGTRPSTRTGRRAGAARASGTGRRTRRADRRRLRAAPQRPGLRRRTCSGPSSASCSVERVAQRRGERLEHRPERLEVQRRPTPCGSGPARARRASRRDRSRPPRGPGRRGRARELVGGRGSTGRSSPPSSATTWATCAATSQLTGPVDWSMRITCAEVDVLEAGEAGHARERRPSPGARPRPRPVAEALSTGRARAGRVGAGLVGIVVELSSSPG